MGAIRVRASTAAVVGTALLLACVGCGGSGSSVVTGEGGLPGGPLGTLPAIEQTPPVEFSLSFSATESGPSILVFTDQDDIHAIAAGLLADADYDDFHELAQYVLDEFAAWDWVPTSSSSAFDTVDEVSTWGCIKQCYRLEGAAQSACILRCGNKTQG